MSHREAWVLQCAKQKQKQKQNLAPPLLFSPPQMKDAIFLPQSPASGSGSIKSLKRFLFLPGHGYVLISGQGQMGSEQRFP